MNVWCDAPVTSCVMSAPVISCDVCSCYFLCDVSSFHFLCDVSCHFLCDVYSCHFLCDVCSCHFLCDVCSCHFLCDVSSCPFLCDVCSCHFLCDVCCCHFLCDVCSWNLRCDICSRSQVPSVPSRSPKGGSGNFNDKRHNWRTREYKHFGLSASIVQVNANMEIETYCTHKRTWYRISESFAKIISCFQLFAILRPWNQINSHGNSWNCVRVSLWIWITLYPLNRPPLLTSSCPSFLWTVVLLCLDLQFLSRLLFQASKYFDVYVKYCSNQIYQDRTIKSIRCAC